MRDIVPLLSRSQVFSGPDLASEDIAHPKRFLIFGIFHEIFKILRMINEGSKVFDLQNSESAKDVLKLLVYCIFHWLRP